MPRRACPRGSSPFCIFLFTCVAVVLHQYSDWIGGNPDPLGVTLEAKYVASVDLSMPLEPQLIEGLNAPFAEFVMKPNAEAAQRQSWGPTPSDGINDSWSTPRGRSRLTARCGHSGSDSRPSAGLRVRGSRASTTAASGLGHPYQESRYRAKATSIACAEVGGSSFRRRPTGQTSRCETVVQGHQQHVVADPLGAGSNVMKRTVHLARTVSDRQLPCG